jgi:hypothetical protein
VFTAIKAAGCGTDVRRFRGRLSPSLARPEGSWFERGMRSVFAGYWS